jgi:hypothetical protein
VIRVDITIGGQVLSTVTAENEGEVGQNVWKYRTNRGKEITHNWSHGALALAYTLIGSEMDAIGVETNAGYDDPPKPRIRSLVDPD